MLNSISKLLIPSLLLSTTFLTPTAALAEQDSNATLSSIRLDPIIISAQKRDEIDKDVPISIESFSDKDIERYNIVSTQDIIAYSPNLSVREGANVADTQLSIRGIGTLIPYADTSVPVFIDGMPLPASQAMTRLENIEHIEVLRGPQGTIVGQNAVAGAINIFTKLPSAKRRTSISAGIGSRGHYQASAHLSGELVKDRVYGGLTISGVKGDGFVHNFATGENADDYDSKYARANLIIKPNDRLEVRLSGDIIDERRPARYFSTRPTYSVNSTDNLKNLTNSYGAGLDILYELDTFQIRSMSNYRQTQIDSIFDFPYKNDNEERITSQELRFTSTGSSRLSWLGGIYLADETVHAIQDAPSFFSIWDTDLKTKRAAAFGEVGYELTDRWKVSAGTRLSYVKRNATQNYTETYSNSVSEFDFKETFVGFTPKISTIYKLTADVNVYGTVSTGFKPGTINFGATSALNAELKSETSTNFEVGFKGNLFDDKLSFGLAGFYIISKDFQAYNLAFQSLNLEKTISKGVEVQASALLATGWRVNGSLGYNKTEIEESDEIAYLGNELTTAPRLTARLGTSYEYNYSDDLLISLAADVTYQSSMWGDINNNPSIKVASYALVNASIGMTYKNLHFDLHGKNLLDKAYAREVSSAQQWTPGDPRTFLGTVKVNF